MLFIETSENFARIPLFIILLNASQPIGIAIVVIIIDFENFHCNPQDQKVDSRKNFRAILAFLIRFPGNIGVIHVLIVFYHGKSLLDLSQSCSKKLPRYP